MAMDEHQLQLAYNQSITATALRTRSAGMHCICHEFERSSLDIFLVTVTPSVNVAEPVPPPPAARGRLTSPSQLMRAPLIAIAEHQLASVASNQNVIVPALHQARLAASAHLEYWDLMKLTNLPLVTTIHVAEPTLPLPAARSRLTYHPQLMGSSQIAIDERQLASVASNQSATATALPVPAASTHLMWHIFETVFTRRHFLSGTATPTNDDGLRSTLPN
jgi:hypothetical protein